MPVNGLLTPAEQRARWQAEKDRLTIRPGETWEQYRIRQHSVDTGARDASRRRQTRRGSCNCPTAYSACKYAVYWRAQQPGATAANTLHGGWGFPTYWADPTSPDHTHHWLVDGTCVWETCPARH